jgi:hypothetical protein
LRWSTTEIGIRPKSNATMRVRRSLSLPVSPTHCSGSTGSA